MVLRSVVAGGTAICGVNAHRLDRRTILAQSKRGIFLSIPEKERCFDRKRQHTKAQK
jgi:hypothetical protein